MHNVVTLKKSAKIGGNSKNLAGPDRRLIQECVAYAQSIAAELAGYEADLEGFSRSAVKAGRSHSTRARIALERITETPAKTPEGLDAKARTVPVIMRNAAGTGVDEHEKAFFVSLGADVRAILAPILQERWRAECASKNGAVSSHT